MTQREEFEKFWMKHCKENHLYCNLFRNSLDMYIDTYAEYAFKGWKEAKAQPQWIPVSERLPDEDGTYFCLGHDGTPFVCLFRTTKYEGKIWLRSTGTKRIYGITHWMPVPTAPEQNK